MNEETKDEIIQILIGISVVLFMIAAMPVAIRSTQCVLPNKNMIEFCESR